MKSEPGHKDLGPGGVTCGHQILSSKGLNYKIKDIVEEASGEAHD